MENHEKEKRGKVAELMYELLDFGRLEQLARDIWDRAPTEVKNEVAGLFAERLKREIVKATEWSEPKRDRYGNVEGPQLAKSVLQDALEKVVAEQLKAWLDANGEALRRDLTERTTAVVNARVEEEAKSMAATVFRKVREGIDKAMRGY